MNVITSCQSLSALATILAVLLFPGISGTARGAKATASKEPAAKAAPIDDKATWLLAGHEGECAPLSLLEKKSQEFKGIKGPNQLAEKLRAMGHKTEVKEFKAGIRPAVEVRALSAGIDVMFVRQEHCDRKPAAAGTP